MFEHREQNIFPGCGQQTNNSVPTLTDYYQCALEPSCLSHPFVLPPPFTPSLPPLLLPSCPPLSPCGSSIHQPPWFSLYPALGGSGAYIKYLETGGLVQQPSNLLSEREREAKSFLSLPLQGGEGDPGRARREGEPHFPVGITERVSGVIRGWTVQPECQNTEEVDVVSAEEERKAT